MKFNCFLLLSLLFTQFAQAQSAEYSIQLNSGLFSYMGSGAEAKTSINYVVEKETGYTNNPYGSQLAPGIGISLSANRITASKFRIGIEAGYEYMQSRIEIENVFTSNSISANGSSYFIHHFLQATPKIGYRIPIKNMFLDIDAVFEFAMIQKRYDKADVEGEDGKTYSIKRDRDDDIMDQRPGLRISVNYKMYNFYLGYSQGIKNFHEGMLCGGNKTVYSRIIRFGLGYRLNN